TEASTHMTGKHAYTYVILRYRHDPLAGEFANVGVVLHSAASNYVGGKFRKTLGRLAKIFPDLDTSAFKSSLHGIERVLERDARRGGDLLSSLKDARSVGLCALSNDDSSFVWGPLGAGVAVNLPQTLDKLFQRFVLRYDEQQRPHRDDAAVWRPVRESL